MVGKVEICGVNTSELKVLSSSECEALLRKAQAGDQAAMDALVTGNLRLVLSVIQRFSGRGESMEDLFQVGCIGLIKALKNFDTSLGLKFSTYGVPMISGEVRRYLRDNAPLRIPRSTRDTAYHVLQAREKLTAEHGREPTMDELAAALGIRREEVVFSLDAISEPVSLYEPVYTDGGENVCVMDQIGDRRSTDEQWLDRLALDTAMAGLEEREKRILSLRFFIGRTQTEVAREIGISQAQVSRLEKNAVNKIKRSMLPS